MRAEAGKILLELEVVRKTASFIYSSPIFPTTKPQKNRSADSADPLQIRGARGLYVIDSFRWCRLSFCPAPRLYRVSIPLTELRASKLGQRLSGPPIVKDAIACERWT
jgi:hypothetical protein